MRAQSARQNPIEALSQFSQSVQALAARISPSVVQISVIGMALDAQTAAAFPDLRGDYLAFEIQ